MPDPVSRVAGEAPPRSSLVFRVGVVGHRPKRLASRPDQRRQLTTRLRRACQEMRAQVEAFAAGPDAGLYLAGAPRLVAVTSLAEGADRLVAEAALDCGYALSCAFPFPREVFARDFDPPTTLEPSSRQRFEALLRRAREGAGLTVLELDGEPASDSLAYARCARVVVAQSDLLIAVWDGGPAEGPGGTPDSVLQALDAGVPVLWVDAHEPFGWRLLRRLADVPGLALGESCERPPAPGGDDDDRLRLARSFGEVVANELGPPAAKGDAAGLARLRESIVAYQGERRPQVNLGLAWKLFRDLVSRFRWSPPRLFTEDYVEQVAAAWPLAAAGTATAAAPHGWINARLRADYAWADKSAERYADLHRSAFVLTSFLTPAAVLLALAPTVLPALRQGAAVTALMGGEGLLVIFILGLLHAERRGRWHARWMELRTLAELIRQLRLVTPTGAGRARPRPRQHLSAYGDPAQSWMSWTVRAVERDLGLPDARATEAYARCCLDNLAELVTEQRRFHAASVTRSETIHLRLHRWSVALFWATVAGAAMHLLLYLTHQVVEGAEAWLLLVAVFCPALAAALASVNNQGEFQRLAKRSLAMRAFFMNEEDLLRALQARAPAPRLAELEPVVRRIADVMVDEVMDWRIVINDRALGV